MVGRPRAGIVPAELPLGLFDRHVVDARVALRHQPFLVEEPVLVAVGAEPLAGVRAPLVGEAHRDPVVGEGPELLDQAVVVLPFPLLGQELDDLVGPGDEAGAIAPAAVGGVGLGAALWVAGVPGVLGGADLLDRGLSGERWQRRSGGHASSLSVTSDASPRDCIYPPPKR